MTTWTNADGLEVKFSTTRAAVRTEGATHSDETTLVYEIADATTLADTDTAAAAGDAPMIPAGALVKDAMFVVETAFTSGGSAVLDLGFKQADGTNIDDDGIDAIAVASLTANSATVGDGALVPSRLANDSYVMATYDTAAFTAGKGKLIIKYVV